MKKKKVPLEGWQTEFRRYKILVKTYRKDQVEQQNLEIFTTGLSQLLEMRRLHKLCFEPTGKEWFEKLVQKN
jgi:hypothetical protein